MNESFTVTPAEAAENTESDSTGDDENRGSRQYTISGLDDDTTYDIQLFPCDNVTIEDGTYSFDDAENSNAGNGEADLGTTGAKIEVVNGAAQATPGRTVEVQPVNGTITFTVDNENANECVVPVVFEDTEDDNTLELDANDEPTEAFGAGGEKSWIPEEAVSGDIGTSSLDAEDELIDSVDKEANRIITDEFTYFYDANDTFFIADSGEETCDEPGDQVTMAQFEAEVSADDQLDGGTFYQPNAELPSSFCLEDVAPAATGTPTAADTDDTSTVLTVPGVSEDADAVTIYGNSDATPDNVDTDDDVYATATEDADPSTAGYQVTVTGLTAETAYEFAATQTVGSEESPISPDVDVTTQEEGATAAFQSIEAVNVNDGGLQGELDTADEIEIGFTQRVNDLDVGDTIRVTDANGESYDLVWTADFTSAPNTTAETLDGRVYEAYEILKITITTPPAIVDRDGNATNNNGVVDYPVTITTQAGINQDADSDRGTDNDGTAWTPADDPDNVIELGGTDAVDNVAPEAIDADFADAAGGAANVFGDEATDVITINYDEPMAVDGVTTVSVDFTGDGTADETYTDGADGITIAAAGNDITITSDGTTVVGNRGTVVLGTSQVTETANIEDTTGNVDTGFPEVIDA